MNLLIVDDDLTNLKLFRTQLESEGHAVFEAHDGVEALALLERQRVDAVISDILMPRMDGYGLCHEIRMHARLHDLPIVLCTSTYTSLDDEKLALDMGADKYLKNPISVEIIITALHEVIAKPHAAPRPEALQEIEVLKEYSERLVFKLEKKNTELQAQTVALRRSEADLKRAQSVAHLGSWSWTIDAERSVWSEECYRVLGFDPSLPPPSRDEEQALHTPESWSRFIAAEEKAIATGDPYVVEIEMARSDGEVRFVVETATPTFDESGRLSGFFGTVHDITERKQAEQALRASEEKLYRSQHMEAIGRLAGGVAHDFNNLLTAIIGNAELLEAGEPGPRELTEGLSEIRKAAERAAALTRQLLAFSRRQALATRVFDLNLVATSMSTLLSRLVGDDVEVTLADAPDLWAVEADSTQIEQVIMNLVVNARDAMPEGGQISIETANVELGEEYVREHPGSQPGPHVMLAVSDTGVGMDEDLIAEIFEPFFTTKGVGKGTGLGLSTVYGIVKQSGGNIWVCSEVGKGTTFKVYLPRVERPIDWGPADARAPALAPTGGGEETILLVEDEPSVRRLATRVLQKQGYQVLEVGSPADALALFEEYGGPIHLLLTDVNLPGMSGLVLAETIASRQGASPRVLFMSGYTQDAIVHDGHLDPDVNFLEKPFTPEGLLRKVREVLDRQIDGQLGLQI